MKRTLSHVFAVVRIDPEFEGFQNQVTVKEIVSTQVEAEKEVARLNSMRKGESFYFWQLTRSVDRSSTSEEND